MLDDDTNDIHDSILDLLTRMVKEVVTCNDRQRQRILQAYREAQSVAAQIDPVMNSTRLRSIVCHGFYEMYLEERAVEALGWMLVAIEERIDERNFEGWQGLQKTARRMVDRALPRPGTTTLH